MVYERVEKYCKEEQITMSEFEKRCGIGNGTVGKWRDKRVDPNLKTLSKISRATGISIGYWLGGIV